MNKLVLLLLGLFLVFTFPPRVESAIATNPSSFSIPRGLQVTQSITYNITGMVGCSQASSSVGEFVSGQYLLGTVNTTLSIPLTGGAGGASENVVIPVAVIKRAEQLAIRRFQYRRQFNYVCQVGAPVELSSVQIALASEATAELRITRLQLYFENQRAEITVKRNQPHLKAFADIRYVGSGLLRGYWEVDGRILSHVNRHLVYGRNVTIESPEVPSLPTFETGTHIVKFVITNPAGDLPTPEAIYFVTAEEFKRIFSIRLISPEDGSEIEYAAPTFRWEGRDQTVTYLIEFLEEGVDKPIFSAYSRNPRYALPPSIFKTLFSQGKGYLWRVKGFDVDLHIVGESSLFRLKFKEHSSHLPGQILVVTERTAKGLERIGTIGEKYRLGLIETYDLNSLWLKVGVFQTDEDLPRLLQAIGLEGGVMFVQPNYIFRTLTEPMSELQKVYSILNLKKLHEYFKGKGVVVAVIDTGVDAQHRDLKERVLLSVNFIRNESYRAEVHGTAVAGIIGAGLNGFGIVGVAPESDLLALRACRQISDEDSEGECYSSSVSKAIDLAIEKRAKIVNMSFGSTSSDPLISKLIEEGSRRGLVFVAPVGNSPNQKALSFPASHPNVISVAGLDEGGTLHPNREVASRARVCAPCANVLSTIPGDRHNFLSGTSVSSATVAGILTLAVGKDGKLEKDQLPSFKGDICQWEEDLLKLSLCEK